MIIAATGHRPDKLGGYGDDVHDALFAVARQYLALTCATQTISGMALGWDMAFALASNDLGIPFVAAVPFEGQESVWPAKSRWAYNGLITRAQHVVIVSPGGYASWKMQRRNEWMVNRCDRLAALWNGSPGGTANCLAYAEKKRKPVDHLWAEFSP